MDVNCFTLACAGDGWRWLPWSSACALDAVAILLQPHADLFQHLNLARFDTPVRHRAPTSSIVWHGKGFLVLVIAFGFSLTANYLCDSITGSRVYWSTHKWPLALSLFASGLVCWFVGRYLRSKKARLLIDPKTGEKIVLRYSHSFFYIPMMWWEPILAGCGVIALLMDVPK